MRAAALTLVALACCVEPTPPIEPQVTSHVAGMEFLPTTANKIDLLFVIDSSPAMAAHRAHLAAKLPLLMDHLGGLTQGLPDLHVGVITANGDGQMHGRGEMTGGFLSDAPEIDGSRTKNYAGTLAEAFRAYADVGIESAAPSRPFEAVELALGPGIDPPGINPGFERPDSHLVVVFVTGSDDAGSENVVDHVERILMRRTDPTRIAAIAISGPRTGTSACGATAAPRIHGFVELFTNRNAAASICDDDLSPAISIVDSLIKKTLGLPCWEDAPADVDLTSAGVQYDCSAYLYDRNDDATALVLPECGASPTTPCWRIFEQPWCASTHPVGLSTRLEPERLALPQTARGYIECVVVAPPSGQNP